MGRWIIVIGLVLLWLMPIFAEAGCEVQTSNATYTNGTNLGGDVCGATGGRKVEHSTLGSGEDQASDLLKTEERYLTMPAGGSTPKIAADQLYKTGVGLVRSIDCYSDATATAGTIAVLDSVAAGAGTKIFEFDVLAVAYNPTGLKQNLNVPFTVGLYLDFTTTADMQCTVRYR